MTASRWQEFDDGLAWRLMIGPHRVATVSQRVDDPGRWCAFVWLPGATGAAPGLIGAAYGSAREAIEVAEGRVEAWFTVAGMIFE